PAGVACAEPAPPYAQLLRGAQDAPRIDALDADVARAQGLAEQARARPNPTLSLFGENFAGSSPYRGFDETQTTLQYNHPIELGGKRAARIAAGRAGVVAAEARSLEGRLDYAWDLARAYAAAEVAERRIGIAADEVEEAQADLVLARALVSAGKEARLRQLQAETELNALQADLEATQATSTLALARLSALAGRTTPFTSLSESLLDRLNAKPAMGPVDPLQSLSVRTAEAEREAASRAIEAQRRMASPDVTAQIGVRRFEPENAAALVAGVSLPLPLFDRNRGNIAAAQAKARGAE
ncbi:TolC family protein, partial [Novosphingobium sp. 1949]